MDGDIVRILVVGAGPAGLAAARALRQAGFSPGLVERRPHWDVAGTGMYLPANGVRALRALGLQESVAARAAVIPRQRYLDFRGRVLFDVDLREVWGGVGACLAITRAELHSVLREGLSVQLGRTVRAVDGIDGPVRVGFEDGVDGEYDLVVGADGLRSAVRRLVVDPRPPAGVGQHSWRFLVACPREVVTWTVLLDRAAAFLAMPVGGGLAYCYADIVGGSPPDGSDPVRDLRDRFAHFAAPVPEILRGLDDRTAVHVAPIEEVAEQRWGRGAVVLVGDAAHGMSPNMAEGAALAFEDALVLASSLRTAGTVAEAVARFVAQRRPRTEWVRTQTHRRDHTRKLPPVVRDVALRAFGQRIFRSNYRPLREPV